MKLKFALLNLFLGCISLFITNTKFISNVKAEELLKVELNTEIKKGNFLIGLKQYLGGENDSFSKKRNITFIADKGFLNLISSNGIQHKSKQINITWADVPVRNPKSSKISFSSSSIPISITKSFHHSLICCPEKIFVAASKTFCKI